jgi:pilus assembly protein CpaF
MPTTQDYLTALGPLAALYQDETVTEFMADAHDKIYVERKGKLEDAGVTFASPEAFRAMLDAVMALEGVTLGPGKTTHEGGIPALDYSRLALAIPPASAHSPCLTLRKFFKTPMTMEKLFEFNALSREGHTLLQSAIRANKSLMSAGGTGSGKTTFLNILTADIPADERVITIEHRYEFQPQAQRVVRLVAEGTENSYADLIELAAQMRPDRLIFSELRGGEIARVLDMIGSGYDGSIMTMHATSPQDALDRMEAMYLMANLGLGLTEIRRNIAANVNVIAYLERLPNGSRKVMDIVELLGLEDDRYVIQPLLRYNVETEKFERSGVKPSWEKA